MNLDPQSSYGSVWYRIRNGVGPGAKVIAWVQRRSWFWFWSDHAPLGNAKVQLGFRIIGTYEDLLAMVKDYEEIGDEEAKALKFIEENCLRDGISRPFRGPVTPKEERLPDNSKEVTEILTRIKKGLDRSTSSAPLRYDRGRLEDKPKGGGARSAYTPEQFNGLIQAFSRTFVNDNKIDHMVPMKGLNDPPKQDKGQSNKQQPNNNRQHNRNDNNRNDDQQ